MLNKVTLIGRLGKAPEDKSAAGNNSVVNLSVVTSSKYKKKTGEMHEDVEWHRVVCFGKLAEIVSKYSDKGRQLYIEGKLKTSSWTDNSGQKRYSTDIIANQVIFLGNKGDIQNTPAAPSSGGVDDYSGAPDMDDEIPF